MLLQVFSIFVACASAASLNYNAPTTVSTSPGSIEGLVLQDGKVKAYLGIPFAASPPERFRAPQDPKTWDGTLKAQKIKPSCMQQLTGAENSDIRNFTITVFSTPMPEESEDCLYLNVWVPGGAAPEGGFPVLFWLYGGNLQFGTAGLPMYDGQYIAADRGVIVVGSNYRTNVFGFPNAPGLPAGEANVGLLDQRKALKWVSSNIKAFGGDASKVTILGESAGGWSVKQLIAIPPSPLSFRAAIMQSEGAGLSGGIESWNALSKALNCTDIACVRKAPATKIKSIIENPPLSFEPVQDDITCSKNISSALTSGKAAKVPFIIGSNAQDGTVFAYVFGQSKPGSPGFEDIGKSLTEITFQCPAASIATIATTSGFPPVYRYFFNATYPKHYPFSQFGAFHSGEIPPVFGTWNKSRPEFERLSQSMQGYWTAFTKDPKAPLNEWPKFEGASQRVKVFGAFEDQIIDAKEIDQACPGMAKDIAIGGL
ncbi:Ferrochelatase [Venturia nashicola]|uniref:Carboxylic ester hydrolase n=1 Tax=Venturia nashicola TaxID=86259 RepID=A0A4Z1NL59_9PEZI|nr:Ferrochelatase [Venturia nashicola]TLD20865.1 Ferrochelatase [Venturia nashicola]